MLYFEAEADYTKYQDECTVCRYTNCAEEEFPCNDCSSNSPNRFERARNIDVIRSCEPNALAVILMEFSFDSCEEAEEWLNEKASDDIIQIL